jgi:hypothetical protein
MLPMLASRVRFVNGDIRRVAVARRADVPHRRFRPRTVAAVAAWQAADVSAPGRMLRDPVAGNVDPPADPDAIVPLDVIEKAL